jgi:hypothetical protein
MCNCGRKNANARKQSGVPRGLTSDLRKSRQLPPPVLRQITQQSRTQIAPNAQQETVKKIRQRSIREKFGHS